MNNVLLVLSSPRGRESYSHRIAHQIVDEIHTHNPQAEVVVRDLTLEPLPHVDEAFVTGRVLPPERRSIEQAESLVLSDALIDEVNAADVIVLAAPMYNFGVPSALKAWIDHIVRPGRTFSYSKSGPMGLVRGKKAILVVARGGVYSDGPMQASDFQESYLRSVLAFIGIVDLEVVRVEGIAMGEDALKQALQRARIHAKGIVRKIAARARDAVLAAA